jgi:hypothetical protein
MYLSVVALKEDGFGKFEHHRELSTSATLYSTAWLDLSSWVTTVTNRPVDNTQVNPTQVK